MFETLMGGDPVRCAAQTIKRLGISSMVVMDHSQVSGILTDMNIVERSSAQGLDPQETPVRKVMVRGEILCAEDQDISEIRDKRDKDVNGKLSGMIAQEHLG